MKKLFSIGKMIADRYQIIGLLGQGGIGITYKAKDLKTNQSVALKVLSLRRSDSTKVLDLFEREIRILAQLNHPAIPRYLDHFQLDQTHDPSFYLVQQLAEGQPLTAWIELGWQPDEATIQQIAMQLLNVLIYLQQLAPPVVHRDIKPQNIIRREDGQLFLVDFGAVQDAYHNTLTGGSTVVGTYGYMAPEQFRGQAVLSTDLYSLGTTLIYLLTQRHPIDLPQRKLKLQFRDQVKLSPTFADWIERLIEPISEDRFASAEEALAVLQGKEDFVRAVDHLFDLPDSPIQLKVTESYLIANIPPVWIRSRHSQLFALIPLVFSIAVVFMLWIASGAFSSYFLAETLVLIRLYGLIGLGTFVAFLSSVLSEIRLEINAKTMRLQRRFWDLGWQEIQQPTNQIAQAILKPTGLSLDKAPITTCVLVGKRKFQFGTFLTESEKAWLVAKINQFLAQQRSV